MGRRGRPGRERGPGCVRRRMKVVVVGSANQDYVVRLEHIPAPKETVVAEAIQKQTGGQGANQAVAASRLGATVTFVGCIGDDHDGSLVLQQLISEGVDTSEVEVVSGKPTGLALVSLLDDGKRSIVVIPGANLALGASRVSRTVRRLVDAETAVLVQGEVPADVISAVVTSAHSAGCRPILNLAPYRPTGSEVLALCDPLVMNEIEASSLLGRTVRGAKDAQNAAEGLTSLARSVVISIGEEGAVWAEAGGSGHVAAPLVEHVVDASGAGDAFVGALAMMLAGRESLDRSLRVAVAAGSFVVSRVGVQSSYPMRGDVVPTTAALAEHQIAVQN
jgi:ribokinase